ncbi:MAG: MFS transporter [Bryobacterales bacterium]|nr:MFS transporter [Bryobacterales bacterium]
MRHRDFRLFIGGQVISLVGTWMQSLALAWLVYRLTGSSVLMGAVGFATHIPVLVLGPLAGMVCDRTSRRTVVFAAQSVFLVQALLLAWLTSSGRISIPWIMVLAALLGAANAFDIPARQSMYIHIVGKDDLPNAIALNSMSFNAARIVGPSVGGFCVALFGETACFLINAASYVMVLAALTAMRGAEPAPKPVAGSALRHLLGGFQYAWRHRRVRALLTVTALANLATTPASVLGPIFADQVFHRGSQGLGLLVGALGLGAVAGTLALARSGNRAALPAVVRHSALLATGTLTGYALSPSFYVSLAVQVLGGFAIFRLLAAVNSLVQASIDDAYRGRIMSLYSMTVVGMLPLGNLAAGLGGQYLGIRMTVLAGAMLSLCAAVVWIRFERAGALQLDHS